MTRAATRDECVKINKDVQFWMKSYILWFSVNNIALTVLQVMELKGHLHKESKDEEREIKKINYVITVLEVLKLIVQFGAYAFFLKFICKVYQGFKIKRSRKNLMKVGILFLIIVNIGEKLSLATLATGGLIWEKIGGDNWVDQRQRYRPDQKWMNYG